MRFDPLAYCFRRKNKIRDGENTDVAGTGQRVLTFRIENDDAGNARVYVCVRPRFFAVIVPAFPSATFPLSIRYELPNASPVDLQKPLHA